MSEQGDVARATGLLVVEVTNSNPNGDPDQESDPRVRPHDGLGLISPVSFKRKVRELVDLKEGPVWREAARKLGISCQDGSWRDDAGFSYELLEKRGRDRNAISQMAAKEFNQAYWDARVFGNTFLEDLQAGASATGSEGAQERAAKSEKRSRKGRNSPVEGDAGNARAAEAVTREHFTRTGVAHFGLGVSLAPIRVHRLTTTKVAEAQAGKSRGMAPLAYRVVEHAVYCLPFTVNPTAAVRTGCRAIDIELLLQVIPSAYRDTPSYVRSQVELRHAWYLEHASLLGNWPDGRIWDLLRPRRIGDSTQPSMRWDGEYESLETTEEVKGKLAELGANDRFRRIVDLVIS